MVNNDLFISGFTRGCHFEAICGKGPRGGLPSYNILDKLVLNFTGMIDVNLTSQAGPTIPTFEA